MSVICISIGKILVNITVSVFWKFNSEYIFLTIFSMCPTFNTIQLQYSFSPNLSNKLPLGLSNKLLITLCNASYKDDLEKNKGCCGNANGTHFKFCL